MNNKANISPIGNLFYYISAGDIMKYLEDAILGFRVDADFTRWTGVTPAHSYVRMRVIIQAKDLIVTKPDEEMDYATRMLHQNQVNYTMDEDVMKSLTPFMYPENFNYSQLAPETVRHLNEIGVIGSKIDEIIKYSRLTLATDRATGKQYFRVYLRPERIIHDMLTNPETGKLDGEAYIRRVTGENSSEFKWLVEQVVNTGNIISSDLSIDQIFALK